VHLNVELTTLLAGWSTALQVIQTTKAWHHADLSVMGPPAGLTWTGAGAACRQWPITASAKRARRWNAWRPPTAATGGDASCAVT